MIIALGAIYMEMEAEHKKYSDQWFLDRCMLLKSSSVALKNPAWRDEQELRCQHVVLVDVDTPIWKIEAAGGESEGKLFDPLPVNFLVQGNGTIVPYFDMPFEVKEDLSPIKEIWLGPKNPNNVGNVKFFLGNSGFGNITLKRAGGAYR